MCQYIFMKYQVYPTIVQKGIIDLSIMKQKHNNFKNIVTDNLDFNIKKAKKYKEFKLNLYRLFQRPRFKSYLSTNIFTFIVNKDFKIINNRNNTSRFRISKMLCFARKKFQF